MLGAVSQLLGESAQDPYVFFPHQLRRTETQPTTFAISPAVKVCAVPAGEPKWRTKPTCSIYQSAQSLYDYLLVFDDEVWDDDQPQKKPAPAGGKTAPKGEGTSKAGTRQ